MIDSEKIHKNFPKKNRILGVVTELQIDFLNDSTLFHTFCDLILIEQAKGFNLRYMTTLEAYGEKKYYVITKKLRQKIINLRQKNIFSNFENMFLEYFCKAFNL